MQRQHDGKQNTSSGSGSGPSNNNQGNWWNIAAGVIAGAAAIGLGGWAAYTEYSYEMERKQHLSEHGENFVTADELEEKLEIGDMIEFHRNHYQHWAIYMGDGKVIHLSNSGEVTIDTLKKVADGGLCRVNLLKNKAQQLDLRPRGSRREIVEYAKDQIGKKRDYHVQEHNCEHFATECFYGIRFSVQGEILDRNGTIAAAARGSAKTWNYQ